MLIFVCEWKGFRMHFIL